HRAYARLGDMGLNYTAVDQTADVTGRRIAAGQCFVAEWSGEIAGTVVVSKASSQHCEYFNRPGVALMSQFAVDPPFQQRGIGRALLQAAIRWSAINGFSEIAVDTAEPAGHLVKFYEKFAFERVGFVQWPGKV